MSAARLASDATIVDIVRSLNKPESYVRGVLENLYACKRALNDAQVRIGITGQGKVPHYRVEPLWAGSALREDSHVFGVFNGWNHKPLSDGPSTHVCWSTEAMELDEIAALLGELRGFNPRKNERRKKN
jgi:hypothetical protein